MRHGVEKVVGHRQADDVQRPVPADQHHAAQQGRPDVVGMGRAADQRFAHHGELHQPFRRKGAAQQFVQPVDGCGRRGGARSDAASGRYLFENRDFDPHGLSVRFEQGRDGRGYDIVFGFFGESLPALVADRKPARTRFGGDLDPVAHAVERQAHDVEAAAQIRHRSGGENLDMFHGKIFFELNCL